MKAFPASLVVPVVIVAAFISSVPAVSAAQFTTPLPSLNYASWTLPPRVELSRPVSVTVEGTVIDAARALAEGAGCDWIVSVREGQPLEKAAFSVTQMQLSRALDKLLEVYDYDWGVTASGVLVCWPAIKPLRARGELEETPQGFAGSCGQQRIEWAKPTALSAALAQVQGRKDTFSLEPELKKWRVCGLITQPGRDGRVEFSLAPKALGALAAAVGAVWHGAPGVFVELRLGPQRRLEAARQLLARDGIAAAPRTLKNELLRSLLRRIREQQWAGMLHYGTAIVPFHELTTQEASLFIEYVDQRASGLGGKVDWAHPERMSVHLRIISGALEDKHRRIRVIPSLIAELVVPRIVQGEARRWSL